MAEPTPVRCPAIEHPDVPPADPGGLVPLLDRLAASARVEGDEAFPLGTLRADGRVDLCKQGLGAPGVARLLPVAASSPHARHVLLGTNAIGDEGASAVADVLRPGHGLETLYLGCNRIGPEGVASLATGLTGDRTVKAVWLKRNPVGNEGARALAGMLRENTTIRTLDLVNTGLGADGLRALLEVLIERSQPLERLFLGGNGLSSAEAELLAALIRDAGVRELYLSANHLRDEGAALVASAADPSRPVRLGLGGNGVTPEGARALAGSLDALESLDLARPPSERALGAPPNVTGDEGAGVLGDALTDSLLRRLDLRRTGLTGRGAKKLLSCVPSDTRLEYVGLGPGVPRRVKRAMAPRLRPDPGTHPDLQAIGSVYR